MKRILHRLCEASIIVPIGALALSAILLFPARNRVESNLVFSVESYMHRPLIDIDSKKFYESFDSRDPQIHAIYMSSDRALDRVRFLNIPALVLTAPLAALSSDHQAWLPRNMDGKVWDALLSPFLDLYFWWIIGRGVDALISLRRNQIRPNLKWFDGITALALLGGGITVAIGHSLAASSEGDDGDGLLTRICICAGMWSALAVLPMLAWVLQFRQNRRQRLLTQTP
jgi:hypothetical protein